MTQNQIRYWELRWKQYYEYYYLQETQRANIARERETMRHNKAEERIAKQELVLKRIEISQNQEKIQQQWEKLKLEEQALLVNAALELRKQDIQAQQFIESQQLAIASLVTQYSNEAEKRQIEKFNAYVNALDVGWTKAAVSKVLTEIESDNTQMQDVLQTMADKYNLEIEVHGPKTWKDRISDTAKKVDSGTSLDDTLRSTSPHHEGLSSVNKQISDQIAKQGLTHSQAVEKYGPAIGIGGKTSVNGGSYNNETRSSVITTTSDMPGVRSTPSSVSGNQTKSSIIYSGGTR